LAHPFFWNEEVRLQFLLKVSDWVEHEDRVPDSLVLPMLEAIGSNVFGCIDQHNMSPNWLLLLVSESFFETAGPVDMEEDGIDHVNARVNARVNAHVNALIVFLLACFTLHPLHM
jgi:hypothetical protein